MSLPASLDAAASADDEDELVFVEKQIEEEVDCWENERYYPFIGWSQQLLPTDRCASPPPQESSKIVAVYHACFL